MMRARIKRFGQGTIKPIPNWIWSLLLASITVIAILVFRGPTLFAPHVDAGSGSGSGSGSVVTPLK
jgi:hypothetical protein